MIHLWERRLPYFLEKPDGRVSKYGIPYTPFIATKVAKASRFGVHVETHPIF
jgi:hypothetical protein